ncbi:MAG: DUF1592 domain-containing protein [Opitutales bacterium]
MSWSGEKERGLRLDIREAALEGGDSGEPAFVPGDPESSELIFMVSLPADDFDFMPAEGDPLTKAQIQTLSDWIEQGASYGTYTGEVEPKDVQPIDVPAHLAFLGKHCYDCHDGTQSEGNLNLEALGFDFENRETLKRWELVFDRIHHGEMPPEQKDRPDSEETDAFLSLLGGELEDAERAHQEVDGRSELRRLNRFEFENTLRDTLDAPWLMVADELPADGTYQFFSKSSRSLEISHVQMLKWLDVTRDALRLAVDAAAWPSETKRVYARQAMRHDGRGMRASLPLLGWETDIAAMTKKKGSQSELHELEAVASFYGAHPALPRHDFRAIRPPIDGQYLIRVNSYSMAAGNNGYPGNGLNKAAPVKPEQEQHQWYRPDRYNIQPSDRIEPVTLYAVHSSGESRPIASFDTGPQPNISESLVSMRSEEYLRPDGARLVRLRPGFGGNKNVENDRIPGWAIRWVEIEGPVTETWPPKSYKALFDDLDFVENDKRVEVLSESPDADALRLIQRFVSKVSNGRGENLDTVDYGVAIYHQARDMGQSFTDAMLEAFAVVILSPDFLYLNAQPGKLDGPAMAERLSYFLWNGPPDAALLEGLAGGADADVLKREMDRMLADERADRFIEHFLDHWLNLRDLDDTVPDVLLYPDYFLDSHLVESARLEAHLFFKTLIEENLSVRNFVDSDFTFLNERLAEHYEIPFSGESGALVRTELPKNSPRGGFLTQAASLKVSANGTTTSPVLRGLWVAERIMGRHIGAPPSGIEAIEPDTRGVVTIKQQLGKHVAFRSCASCHEKFDPLGFALESFDVMGGFRESYRSLSDTREPVHGFGMNGHAFKFSYAHGVESDAVLDGEYAFQDIHELKAILLEKDRKVAETFLHRLVMYSTGARVSFADRAEINAILDKHEPAGYPVRDLMFELIQSDLFARK